MTEFSFRNEKIRALESGRYGFIKTTADNPPLELHIINRKTAFRIEVLQPEFTRVSIIFRSVIDAIYLEDCISEF